MQASISLDDVIDSATKYGGCVLTYNAKKARDLKTLNPKSKYDTTYIPLLFKHINGKELNVKIKFLEQVIGSSAKAPQGSDEEGVPKHLNISFMKLNRDDVEGGDYVPKEKSTPERQLVEDKRISDNIDRYMVNNTKFIKVLDIIDKSYKTVCEELKVKEKSFPFRLCKDRNQKDLNVFSIKQETRLNRDTNQDEPLENPIYRLKVPVCKKDGRIGIWSTYHNTFKPTVFDARKMNKKNNHQRVPAKVNVDGKLRDLDVTSASSFIVYKSLIGGEITFECVVASKFGLSLNNSFYELHVYRHKSKSTTQSMSKADIIQMRGGGSEDEEDEEDAELVDEKDSSVNENGTENTDENANETTDQEPVDTDEEEDDEDDDEDDEDESADTDGGNPDIKTDSTPKTSLKAGKRSK